MLVPRKNNIEDNAGTDEEDGVISNNECAVVHIILLLPDK